MFLNIEQIRKSLENLEAIHPFYGLTFLVCKAGKLPVGSAVEFPINAEEKKFLDQYYKPNKDSKFFYRVFRISDKSKRWLEPDHASSGSQSTRTKRGFAEAFIHNKGTSVWGWQRDYVKKLKPQLYRKRLIPAFDLAVWLYRERDWPSGTTAEDIVKFFLRDFGITIDEQHSLFDVSIPENLDSKSLFQENKISWEELQTVTGKPPDAPPEEGGTLTYLMLRGVGPAKQLEIEPAERISLITGDNGLGKTFLLECAWWALTGQWAGLPAYPRQDAKANEPQIIFQISGTEEKIGYDWQTQSWPSPKGRQRLTIPGLLIYARVDGSFAVWDPAQYYSVSTIRDVGLPSGAFVFTKDQVWEGLEEKVGGKPRVYSNGLLRDWIIWQNKPEGSPFDTFKRVLHRLSPRDLGLLEPGNPVRLPFDAREIPTLKHPYGEVPILHAAAGIRRIVAMAYLIVWAWEEHKTHSKLVRRDPQKRMVILIDEIEAHLHPRWQRIILPALLDTSEELAHDLQVQFIIATHSPLVTASLEPKFDANVDKLFHLDLSANEARLEEQPFIRHGTVNDWLMSDAFGLRHARSPEAENAIEEAKALQLQDTPKQEDVQSVSEKLVKYLAADDEFWPRWKYFAEKHGVRL